MEATKALRALHTALSELDPIHIAWIANHPILVLGSQDKAAQGSVFAFDNPNSSSTASEGPGEADSHGKQAQSPVSIPNRDEVRAGSPKLPPTSASIPHLRSKPAVLQGHAIPTIHASDAQGDGDTAREIYRHATPAGRTHISTIDQVLWARLVRCVRSLHEAAGQHARNEGRI